MENKTGKKLARLETKARELKEKAKRVHAKAKELHQKHIMHKLGKRIEKINSKSPSSAFAGMNRFLASFAAKKAADQKKDEEKIGQEKNIDTTPVIINTEHKNGPDAGIITETHGKDVKISSTQLKRQWIFTEYDRVLAAITMKGIISATELATELGMTQQKVRECYLTLEKSGAIRVDYPLFGSPKLVSIAYEKEKKRQERLDKGLSIDSDEYGREMIV